MNLKNLLLVVLIGLHSSVAAETPSSIFEGVRLHLDSITSGTVHLVPAPGSEELIEQSITFDRAIGCSKYSSQQVRDKVYIVRSNSWFSLDTHTGRIEFTGPLRTSVLSFGGILTMDPLAFGCADWGNINHNTYTDIISGMQKFMKRGTIRTDLSDGELTTIQCPTVSMSSKFGKEYQDYLLVKVKTKAGSKVSTIQEIKGVACLKDADPSKSNPHTATIIQWDEVQGITVPVRCTYTQYKKEVDITLQWESVNQPVNAAVFDVDDLKNAKLIAR